MGKEYFDQKIKTRIKLVEKEKFSTTQLKKQLRHALYRQSLIQTIVLLSQRSTPFSTFSELTNTQ